MMNKPIYLQSVKFLKSKYVLKEGLSIDFKNVTLLVGEQGCGKSTLLELLQKNSKIINMTLSEFVLENGIETFYFDSEKMNPRIADIEASYSNPDGTSKGIGIGAAIKSRFMSHGEVLKEFTVNRISKAKNCILFLDEPESSLSLRNQYILVNEIRKAEDTVQFVIATHCLPLIAAFDEVYSLEHLKWMKSDEFIRLNM